MKAPIKNATDYAALQAHVAKMREPAKYGLMLQLSFKLGLRPIEIAQLETSQFSDGELRIQIGHTKCKRNGRSLPVDQTIMDALNAYMDGRKGRVFLNRDGEPMDSAAIQKAMSRLYREAGQRGSCYSGRRTAAQNMLEANQNILIIQAFLGHKSPLTTLSYVGVSQNQLRAAMFS